MAPDQQVGPPPVKVLIVSSHPVQYAVPLYRRYSSDPRIDLTVAFCSLHGTRESVDPEFGVRPAWDVPLLDGYRWVHPKNRAPKESLLRFFGLINPGLWRLIRNGRYDVVVIFGYRAVSFWIAILATRLSGAQLVLPSEAWKSDREGRKDRLKRLVLPRIYGLAASCMAQSTRTVEFLRSLGIPRDRIVLTPYVVDNDYFANASASVNRVEVRRRWGIPVDACVAAFVGKLVPRKRPQALLEAVAAVPGIHAVFAGSGRSEPDLRRRADELGIGDRTHWLGFVNQSGLPEVYAASDVVVLPSEFEPFGLVVNEAFACGRPVIATEACGAARDLVIDGETGFVVPVADDAAIANRLGLLAGSSELREMMGEGARVRISQWAPEHNALAFAEACISLAGRNRNA